MIYRASKQDFSLWLTISTLFIAITAITSATQTPAFAEAHAKTSIQSWPKKCAPAPYEGDKTAVVKEGSRAFKKISNDKLLNAFFFELTHMHDVPFAQALADYLQSSEAKPERKTFIEILIRASKLDSPEPRKLETKELCDHYALYLKKYE